VEHKVKSVIIHPGMADEGAKLVVVDINLEKAEATAKEIRAKGREVLALKTDVSSQESTQEMVKKAVDRFASTKLF
jgi:3-hydroxybutyrate dehydrogenase